LIAAEAKEAEAREAAAKLAPQELEAPDSEEEAELSGSKVVVIHIGSRIMRIGLASDTFPQNIPMVIARPTISPPEETVPQPVRGDQEPLFGSAFEDGVAKLDVILKARLKQAKKRSVPNARELVASYNRRSQWEEILDINDPEQIEWIDLNAETKYVTGEKVSKSPVFVGMGLTVG
jgi:actin-related protein 8